MTRLVDEQLAAVQARVRQVDLSAAKRKNLTPYDVLTIASMVEREAQIARERPLIASVIYNRLREGIPLGIDATVRFATNNWTQAADAVAAGHSTRPTTRARTRACRRGRSAARAWPRSGPPRGPRRTGYLFYVVKPGTCGEHDFSETDAEFQRDVERYNRERERRGGKSPTNC